MKERYNLEVQDYFKMLDEQQGLCCICKEEPANRIDHCHVSGKVRGIACHGCNVGIGYFKESVKRLSGAIEYLELNT